ncbi:Ureidoglycolate lyase [Spathaspora sp. JA1]|nr:Ureidoglycolate lyase [Spathaspora sp. JA1]
MVLISFSGSLIPPITAKPLTPENFKEYGGVISPEHQVNSEKANANYGTAIKIPKVTPVINDYKNSKSGSGTANLNIFRCSRPDHLLTQTGDDWKYIATVLERHPFTTQTFLPLGQEDDICYLVIVAKANSLIEIPDSLDIEAFVCRGNQSVTYGVGVWHAPMVAISDHSIDFAVLVHESGVPEEDTQECGYNPGFEINFKM